MRPLITATLVIPFIFLSVQTAVKEIQEDICYEDQTCYLPTLCKELYSIIEADPNDNDTLTPKGEKARGTYKQYCIERDKKNF